MQKKKNGMQLQKASHEQNMASVCERTETVVTASKNDHTKMASSEGKTQRDGRATNDQSMAVSPSLLKEPHPTAVANRKPGTEEESE